MPRSLAHGDYRLLMAVESASRANSWYRVLIDHHAGQLSCDCPAWTFRQTAGSANTGRSCKHTRIAQLLMSPAGGVNARLAGQPVERASGAAAETHPLVQATRQQWPGLGGRWSFEQRTSTIDDQPYHFVLLHLTTGNGTTATGLVAFAHRYHSLISDEERTLSVVEHYNIFPPHSDDYHHREEETIPAVWQAIPA